MQTIAAGVVLLGLVGDFRVFVLLVALGLLATYVRIERPYRITWIVEIGLLALSTVLFFAGRGGWAWVLASLAAGIAALAAMAQVWILPDRG
jgi:hypothetical protein